jgi:hypothetical protein
MVQLLRLTPLLPLASALSQQAPNAKRVAIIGPPPL